MNYEDFYDKRPGYEKGPKKVIFLDMDGVLCTSRAIIATKDKGIARALDPIGIQLLNVLNEEMNNELGVVVSSTWRNLGEPMTILLQSVGLRIPTMWNWRTPNFGKARGYEIKDWLDNHPHIENYVIFDDDTDMLPEQKDHFVNTDVDDGILTKHYYRAVQILTNTLTPEVDPVDITKVEGAEGLEPWLTGGK